jgi:hypothetical protein
MADSSRLEPYTPSLSDEGWIDRVDESVRDTLRKRSAEHKRLMAALRSPDDAKWRENWDAVSPLGERPVDAKLLMENQQLRQRIRELEDGKAVSGAPKART